MDASYWSFSSSSNPYCARDLLFEAAADAASRDPAEATVLDQGRSGTCVRCAIGSAVEDQMAAHPELQLKIAPMSVVDCLMQKLRYASGTFPQVFDRHEGNVRDEDGRWYLIKLRVTEVTTQFYNDAVKGSATIPHCEYPHLTQIICYDCNGIHAGMTHGRHCIYLQGFDASTLKWIGHNSWGKHHTKPLISVHAPGNSIYNVDVVFVEKLKGTAGAVNEVLLDKEVYRQAMQLLKEADCHFVADVFRELPVEMQLNEQIVTFAIEMCSAESGAYDNKTPPVCALFSVLPSECQQKEHIVQLFFEKNISPTWISDLFRRLPAEIQEREAVAHLAFEKCYSFDRNLGGGFHDFFRVLPAKLHTADLIDKAFRKISSWGVSGLYPALLDEFKNRESVMNLAFEKCYSKDIHELYEALPAHFQKKDRIIKKAFKLAHGYTDGRKGPLVNAVMDRTGLYYYWDEERGAAVHDVRLQREVKYPDFD